jgi:hypothetical protein
MFRRCNKHGRKDGSRLTARPAGGLLWDFGRSPLAASVCQGSRHQYVEGHDISMSCVVISVSRGVRHQHLTGHTYRTDLLSVNNSAKRRMLPRLLDVPGFSGMRRRKLKLNGNKHSEYKQAVQIFDLQRFGRPQSITFKTVMPMNKKKS